MKKINVLFLTFVLLIFLVGCGDYKPSKSDIVKITYESSDHTGNTYNYVYSVNNSDIDAIKSVGYTTATEVYTNLKTEIGNKTVFLNITFEVVDIDVLTLNYIVNKNAENMGLSLLKETIK